MGERYVLRGITWTFREGEHWALMGLNGSGKTTLLNLIAGYVFPSEGSLSVFGKRFGGHDWRRVRRSIGFISSSLQERLYGSETAEEIVLSGIYGTIGLYDRPGRGDRDRALYLLDEFGCGPAAKQYYGALSQGEKQKVLIARALMSSPRLLIMDEPCAGLDMFAREKLLAAIDTMAGKKSSPSILYVSHHTEEILPLFTDVLLLREGMVHSAGKAEKVLTRKNLSSFFETPVAVRRRNNRVWVTV